jgi:hypothetical protein
MFNDFLNIKHIYLNEEFLFIFVDKSFFNIHGKIEEILPLEFLKKN